MRLHEIYLTLPGTQFAHTTIVKIISIQNKHYVCILKKRYDILEYDLFYRALTALTGYSIGTHNIEEHISIVTYDESENGNAINSVTGEPAGSIGLEGSTDLYIYGIDAQEGLVKTDEMIR